MNRNESNISYLPYFYILVITCIICVLPFFANRLSWSVMLIVLAVTMTCIVILWLQKLSRSNLYINNVLNLIAPVILAYIFITFVIKSTSTINGFIAGVAVMDVFSFTKRGKHTLNAKLASNVNTMARLSICLPIPGKPGLQQIIGIGDLFYYSMITLFFIHSGGLSAGRYAAFVILAGQLVNCVSIVILKRIQKDRYKGFPATIFPGLFIIIAYIIHVL